MRFLHIADIHIRDIGRDKFAQALAQLRDVRADVAIVAGDIFHYKTKLTAENLADFYAFLDILAECVNGIIIVPGNHDANINNEDSIDLLSPVLANCRELRCRIAYAQRDGWHEFVFAPGFRFFVFSPIGAAQYTAPGPAPGASGIPIAIAHDFVEGMKYGIASSYDGPIKRDWLAQFTAVFCGHVHDYQAQGNAVYCGALTQLTIGETYDKGYVLWDITSQRSATHQFHRIETDGAFVKFTVSRNAGVVQVRRNALRNDATLPKSIARAVIEFKVQLEQRERDAVIAHIREQCSQSSMSSQFEMIMPPSITVSGTSGGSPNTLHNAQDTHDLLTRHLRADNAQIDTATIARVLELHRATIAQVVERENGANMARWRLLELEWDDMFCYGTGNVIDFSDLRGIVGIIAPNKSGKSAIIDILALVLFNEPLRGSTRSLVRRGASRCSVRVVWTESDKRHEITRRWDTAAHSEMKYTIDGVNMTRESLPATYVQVERSVGTLLDFNAAVLLSQHSGESFIDATDAQRRTILGRVLALDIFDEALAHTRSRVLECQATIRATSAIIGVHTQNRPVASVDIAKLRTVRDAAVAMLAKSAARLRELEALVRPSAPARTVEDHNALIARISADIAQDTGALTAARETLAGLASGTDASDGDPSSAVQIRAKITQLAGLIDQKMLSLGLANKTPMANVPKLLVEAEDKLAILREIHSHQALLRDARDAHDANIPKQSLEEIKANLSASIAAFDKGLPRKCVCAGAAEATHESLVALENAYARATFAQTDIPERIAKMSTAEIYAAFDKARDIPVVDLALMATHLTCASNGERAANVEALKAQILRARACLGQHALIEANEKARADVARLTKERDICERSLIRRRIDELMAKLSTHTGTAQDIPQMICAVERDIGMLRDLQTNERAIRDNMARNAERITLMEQLETMMITQKAKVAEIAARNAVADLEARIERQNKTLAQMRAETDTLRRAHDEMRAYQTAMAELSSIRSHWTVERRALDELEAEIVASTNAVDELKRANMRINEAQDELHILELYRKALGAKNGIQHAVISTTMPRIEDQINMTMVPIAGLKVHLAFEGHNLRVNVRDIARDIEHSADLCSGFQRFALNISIRRAFLRCALRPMPQFLLIDEGFGCLDTANMERIVSFLPELAADLDFMLIISHIDALQLAITLPIRLELGAMFSRVAHGRTSAINSATLAPITKNKFTARKKESTPSVGVSSGLDPAIVERRQDGTYFCKICAADFKIWTRHAASKKHIKKLAKLHAN